MDNRNHKHLNLEDIAQLSGVSRSTVSRVINKHPNVNENTRQRVMAIIEQYNFQPHPAARALASVQSRVIGVLIPHVVSDIFTDPFFSIMLQSITTRANQLDYTALLWLTSSEADEDHFYNRVFNNRLMDGLIVMSAMVDAQFLQRLDEYRKPYILIGRPFASEANANYVDSENQQGAYQMVKHLIARGYKRIGMIPGRPDLTSTQDRQQGYIQALQESGIRIDLNLIAPAHDYSETTGYSGMKLLLQRKVDAVFAANDVIALGAMRAVREAGLRIPDDVAIGGFDDIRGAELAEPPLTTIRQPITALGEVATQGLIGLLEGQIAPPICHILPTDLVVRQST